MGCVFAFNLPLIATGATTGTNRRILRSALISREKDRRL